jgi:hypothetical protein
VYIYTLRRNSKIKLAASKRAERVMRILDGKLDPNVEAAMSGAKHLRASVLLSRAARVALKFPKHSRSNEIVVADWLNRHAPESMSFTQRSHIFPLAIKLTFVKGKHEVAADAHWDVLKHLVESDSY